MSHWFDRLASWSAGDQDDGEELRLTRRQAVRTAATGAGAAGLLGLGSPLVGRALADAGSCACQRAQRADNHRVMHNLRQNFLDNTGTYILVPAASAVFLGALITISLENTAALMRCGSCESQVPLKPPPPQFQPCTQRGGIRLRGDQCPGPPGGAGAEAGGCGGGTSSCPTPGGGDLCCFGSDLCCSGCCCVAEVGCGCCG
ncbi:MAG: hypothetical protein AB7V58_08445 [Solirubrobacterales bacterium]